MTKSKQNLKIKLIFILLIISNCFNILVLFTWLKAGALKSYSSKQHLCIDFAQKYLKTIPKTDNIMDYGGEKWLSAIAIESDMYNMCLLDLNRDDVKQFKLTNIERL